MDCKKHSSSNSAYIKVNEGSMYRDMGLAPAQRAVFVHWFSDKRSMWTLFNFIMLFWGQTFGCFYAFPPSWNAKQTGNETTVLETQLNENAYWYTDPAYLETAQTIICNE